MPLTPSMYVVDSETGCHNWQGSLNNKGYGRVRRNGKVHTAHRWQWELINGPVPPGLVLDHYACDNRQCVNPDHVRPVSVRENTLRGNTIPAQNLAKTRATCGHELVLMSDGKRRCPPCRNRRPRRS
jgi:hypothetical protein